MARSYCIILLFLVLPSTCQEKNATWLTDVVDIRDKNHKITRYIAVLFFVVLLLCGIISNTLLAIVVFSKQQNNHYNREFILIVLQVIIANFTAFLPQILVVLPEILKTKDSSYSNEMVWINHVFATSNTFSLFSILHFSLLLTLNRFVAIILPKYYTLFESAKLYFLIAFIWFSALAITSADFYYCARRFLVWNLSWEANCANLSGIRQTWWRVSYRWALLIPNIMFVMYIVIFYSIRRKRHFATNSNQNIMNRNARHGSNTMKLSYYEWSMLIQAAWNCGVWIIGVIVFNFLSPTLTKIFGKEADLPSRIFINCYIIFICSVLPTVHFIYSKQSRAIIKHHLYGWLQLRLGKLKVRPLSKVCWDTKHNMNVVVVAK
uniref:G_PROTEIN_RECEP_F1_2 domain-containing protein n=2 Tax=Wuchereria bancrofti TaxID=6293 RepID=A0AAF5PZK6_WUCBA